MYLALYRKYRPKTFDDVISQPHITTTLTNQIKTGSSAHAYLFTGSRGTGKTTCAKILAMAVNCLNPRDGSPCLECANCRDIENGTPDVVEMDAASNNGVDDVRALRDEVAYTPVSCKKRVYIIDEVHMLSASAFNALLKTLEEPPPHVVFILATTESHKVPATILSRCQRFEFRRIDTEDSAARLMHIAQLENITLEKNAALLISRLSDGGMRDALSILDQCIGISDNVTTAVVRESAGVAGREHLFRLADCIKNSDTAGALLILDELHKGSKDIGRLVEELIGHFRNLMLLKVMPDDLSLVTALPDEMDEFRRQNDGLSMSTIMRTLSLLQECGESLSRTKQRKTLVEMYLIKLCNPSTDSSAAALAQRVERLESAVSGGAPLNISSETIERRQGTPLHTENTTPEEKLPEISKRPVSSAVSGMLDKIHELTSAHSGEKPQSAAAAPADRMAKQIADSETVEKISEQAAPTAVVTDSTAESSQTSLNSVNSFNRVKSSSANTELDVKTHGTAVTAAGAVAPTVGVAAPEASETSDGESSEQLPFDLDESDSAENVAVSATNSDEKAEAAPEAPVFATSTDLAESDSAAEETSAEDDIDGQVGFDFPLADEPQTAEPKSQEQPAPQTVPESVPTIDEKALKADEKAVSESEEQSAVTSEKLVEQSDSSAASTAPTAPSESLSGQAVESSKAEQAEDLTQQTESVESAFTSADTTTTTEKQTAAEPTADNIQAPDFDDVPPPSEQSAPAAPDDFAPPPFDDYGAPPPERDELPPLEFSPRGLKTRLPDVPPEKPLVVEKKVEFAQGEFMPDESKLVEKWGEIAANAPAALGSLLDGSKAYYDGAFIRVYPQNSMLDGFVNRGTNKERLEGVVQNILGHSYKIAVVPPKVTNVRESSAVEKLFARAQELGINIITLDK